MKIVFEIPYPPTKAGRTAWSKLYGLESTGHSAKRTPNTGIILCVQNCAGRV